MISLRRCIELLARGKILTRRIQVNGKKYPIIVSPDAQLKYFKSKAFGEFDKDLINIAQIFVQEDSIVWDIGANVGVFTFASSIIAKHGKIVSVEPDNWLVGVLRKTQKIEPYCDRDIKIVTAAISENNGIATFHIANRGRASNSLELAGGRSQMGGIREKQYVPTITMDSMLSSLSDPPDFVKVDVEGAEAMVIEGGTKVVQEARPIFYIEVSQKTRKAIVSKLEKEDYRIYSDLNEELNNIFVVPADKSATFENTIKNKASLSDINIVPMQNNTE